MITWTIGSGGLLGSAINRQSHHSFEGTPIPWHSAEDASAALRADAQRFKAQAQGGPWAIVWAAGRATVSSDDAQTQGELDLFLTFLETLKTDHPVGQGAFLLASSAGGVYAGSANPPFTSRTAPRPLSAYGQLKLAQEEAAREALQDVCRVILGRFSNLYGPGQDLGKLQGLISRLALAAVSRESVNMFVSLDTIRDYLFTEDAAALAHYWIDRAVHHPDANAAVRVIASGQPTSLGQLITLMQDVTRTRIPVAMGVHASASAQSQDLRLARSGGRSTERFIRTPLPVGAKLVYLDILDRFQRAQTGRHRPA